MILVTFIRIPGQWKHKILVYSKNIRNFYIYKTLKITYFLCLFVKIRDSKNDSTTDVASTKIDRRYGANQCKRMHIVTTMKVYVYVCMNTRKPFVSDVF